MVGNWDGAFNRTIVELKHKKNHGKVLGYSLLIVP